MVNLESFRINISHGPVFAMAQHRYFSHLISTLTWPGVYARRENMPEELIAGFLNYNSYSAGN